MASKAASLPGPRGHPIFGSLPELRRDVLGFFSRCARDYGDICRFRLLHIPCCLINHPALIEQLLVDEADRVGRTWDLRQLKVALGNGLLTNDGESWRRQRRLIQPAFAKERIDDYAAVMIDCAERMLSAWQDGDERDVHRDLMHLTLEIVAEALFKVELSDRAEIAEQALAQFMHGFEAMFKWRVPLPMAVPTPTNLRTKRAARRLERVADDIIRERCGSDALGDDLLLRLLAEGDGETPADVERQARDEVITLITAGHETTAIALTWTLYLLAGHGEVERQLVAELDRVLAGRMPAAQDVAALPYTKQVIQESMRLLPPAWGTGRETIGEISLGEYRIPPRTQVYIAQYVLHRDARFFPDPERFRPERWAADQISRIPRYAYLPFSAGPRHCVGSPFAMMEATLLLAAILQRFHLSLVPDHPIELQPAVTLRPRYGVRVTLHKR